MAQLVIHLVNEKFCILIQQAYNAAAVIRQMKKLAMHKD